MRIDQKQQNQIGISSATSLCGRRLIAPNIMTECVNINCLEKTLELAYMADMLSRNTVGEAKYHVFNEPSLTKTR